MKDLLHMIATDLVDNPEQVSISEREEDNKGCCGYYRIG